MTITVTIGGLEYTTVVQGTGGFNITSLTIEDIIAPTGDLADITGIFKYPEDIPGRLPRTEMEIVIKFDGVTIFGGVVEKINTKVMSERLININVQARDYVKWLDQKLVSGVFVDSTAGEMVTNLVNSFTTGFTTTNINNVSTILPMAFNWVPMSEAIQEIATRVDATWWIDELRDVHFIKADELLNPTPLIEYDVDTELNVGNLRFTHDSSGLQNALVVKDFFFRGPNIWFDPGDTAFLGGDVGRELTDNQRTIELPYATYDLSDFTFELNETPGSATWVTKTPVWDVAANEPGEGNTDTSFVYVKPGATRRENTTVRWTFTHASGSHIRISFRPLFANVFPEISREVISIDEMSDRESAGGRTSDGIYERLINFEDLEFGGVNPIQSLLDFGAAVLKAHAWPLIEGTFETISDYYVGWKAGQRMFLTSEVFDIFDLQTWVSAGKPELGGGALYKEVKSPIPVWITAVRIVPLSYDVLSYKLTFSSVARPI